jgi:NitT/TauT family transport system permease protein
MSDERGRTLPAEGTQPVLEEAQSAAASTGVPGVELSAGPRTGLLRPVLAVITLLLVLALTWEGAKLVAGDRWRYDDFLNTGIAFHHDPPLRVSQFSDRQLPHLWDIGAALFQPVQRGAQQSLGEFLVGAALYTWHEAIIGFFLGGLIGLTLASFFVHFRLLERAFVPYVIASQAIPIVALAPIIVVGFGRGLVAVVFIATYLTFFPVTIAAMRGLNSPDPRALELMRSYAASRWSIFWKVRLPASVPYLFTALKIAATASIVGAIIGEGPGGVPEGLGRAIINFNQQYITGPEKLWATILVASALGITFFSLVRLAEALVLRGRQRIET